MDGARPLEATGDQDNRIDGAPYAGQRVEETEHSATNCVVVAIERDGRLETDVGPDTGIREDDRLLVVGSDEELDAITR